MKSTGIGWQKTEKIHWNKLSENPNAIHLLDPGGQSPTGAWCGESGRFIRCSARAEQTTPCFDANSEKIYWPRLSANPNAIHLLEANPEKINWDSLSFNPNAIHMFEANPDKIDWCYLSCNPNAIHLLEANPDKIVWDSLSQNSNAIHLLEQNPDKIDWETVWQNPAIFDVHETPVLK